MPRSIREQPLIVNGYGKIDLHKNVRFGEWNSPNFFNTSAYIEARNKDSEITIKSGVRINNNFSCQALSCSVIINENCLIGANVTIINSDFHERNHLDRNGVYAPQSENVHIGRNVWIGSNVMITKGSKIPDNAFIKANTIITRNSKYEI